jgi:hypothetical protein
MKKMRKRPLKHFCGLTTRFFFINFLNYQKKIRGCNFHASEQHNEHCDPINLSQAIISAKK